MDGDYLAQQVAASSAEAQQAAATAAVAAASAGGDVDENILEETAARAASQSQSRLLKRRKMQSRPKSKLLCFLLAKPDHDDISTEGERLERQRAADRKILAHLLSLNASAVDLEFRSLQTVGPGFGFGFGGGFGDDASEGDADDSQVTKVDLLRSLLGLFDRLLDERTSFQAVQAYLDLFLTIFQGDLLAEPKLQKAVHDLTHRHSNIWTHLQQLLQNNLCLLHYLSGQQ